MLFRSARLDELMTTDRRCIATRRARSSPSRSSTLSVGRFLCTLSSGTGQMSCKSKDCPVEIQRSPPNPCCRPRKVQEIIIDPRVRRFASIEWIAGVGHLVRSKICLIAFVNRLIWSMVGSTGGPGRDGVVRAQCAGTERKATSKIMIFLLSDIWTVYVCHNLAENGLL